MRRLRHHQRQAACRDRAHRLFAQIFGALVGDPALAAALRHILAQGAVHPMRIRRHAGGVDECRHARRQRGLGQRARTFHVHPGLTIVVGRPLAGVGGGVKYRIERLREGRCQLLGLHQIAAYRRHCVGYQDGIGARRA